MVRGDNLGEFSLEVDDDAHERGEEKMELEAVAE